MQVKRCSEAALESRARRAAHRVGLVARKATWRAGTIDNLGGFNLIDPSYNIPVAGQGRYGLTAEEVIAYCDD